MDRLLGVAKELQKKVDSNEMAASELLKQCEVLQQELKSMRQYRTVLQEMSGGEPRPRIPNIEFGYIKQLQQDNSELRTLLEEHQAALEMIMGKYRQQMGTFMNMKHEELELNFNEQLAEELQLRTDQVCNMAAVMYRAALIEDSSAQSTAEKMSRLEYENRYYRELLQFSTPVPLGSDHSQSTTTAGTELARALSLQQAGKTATIVPPNPLTPLNTSVSKTSYSNPEAADSRSSTPRVDLDDANQGIQTFTGDSCQIIP